MSVFSNPAFDDHEKVTFCRDAATGLSAIIAIHSTALGPAAGGCRLWSYESDADALYDVLRLSRGMSYKNAMADLQFGGGKAVIIKSASFAGSDELYEKFGDFVDSFHGDYVTAEDVGMSVAVMEKIARRTRFVSGLTKKAGHAGGDPSPKTAFGIFKGIEAAVEFKLGSDTLRGLSVAVQGVGNVGHYLCGYLAEAGAKLVVADIDQARIQRVVTEFGAQPVALDDILFQDVDVVAPCALGAVLNEQSIPQIKSSIVAGGANNQLQTDADGRRLMESGILYAPDYVINGGGIINVASEFYGDVDEEEVMHRIAAIGPRLSGIFQEATDSGLPTNEIADSQARRKIAEAKSSAA